MTSLDLSILTTRLSLQPNAWNGLCLEAADELTRMRSEIERLTAIVDRLPELVGIVASDCGAMNDSRPSLYKRGNVWRYHVQRCGNQWADDADPIKAAEAARSK